jgi:hypothetical protein
MAQYCLARPTCGAHLPGKIRHGTFLPPARSHLHDACRVGRSDAASPVQLSLLRGVFGFLLFSMTIDIETTDDPYRCPACKAVTPMLVVKPHWVCPCCDARLIPADRKTRAQESRPPDPDSVAL